MTYREQGSAEPWQQWHISVANSSDGSDGGMCHTEQMGHTKREEREDVGESALAFTCIPREVSRRKGLSALLFHYSPP